MERKEFAVAVTDVDAKQGRIETIAAVMGNVDEGLDRIQPGAFTRTLRERGTRIKVGWQHSLDHPLGKTLEAEEIGVNRLPSEVLKIAPSATGGLRTVGQVSMTPTNVERLQLISDGVVDGTSIGYDAMRTSFSNEDGKTIRNLHEVRLWEWSPVTLGMNQAAMVVGVKGLKAIEGSYEELGHRVCNAVRGSGAFDGDMYVTGTFSDHVILNVYSEDEPAKSYSVMFSFGPDGEIVLGDVAEVAVREVVEPKAQTIRDLALLVNQLKTDTLPKHLGEAARLLAILESTDEESATKAAPEGESADAAAPVMLTDWLDVRVKQADIDMLFYRARMAGAI